jgi:hypothetical protein
LYPHLQVDPNYDANERAFKAISREILGEDESSDEGGWMGPNEKWRAQQRATLLLEST